MKSVIIVASQSKNHRFSGTTIVLAMGYYFYSISFFGRRNQQDSLKKNLDFFANLCYNRYNRVFLLYESYYLEEANMQAEFRKIPGRTAQQFHLDDTVYIFCDRDKLPANLRHLSNFYSRSRVVGFIRKDSIEAKLAVQLSASDVIYVDPTTYEVLTPAEARRALLISELSCELAQQALQRLRQSECVPHPLPEGTYPELLMGDDCVAFCPPLCPAYGAHVPPQIINTFLTGYVYGFADSCTLVCTDQECRITDNLGSRRAYPYCVGLDSPMIMWRGYYEQLRRHPDWADAWLDRFEFPLVYQEIETSREEFRQLLLDSFAQIPAVEYYI